jgi:uncharacterized protein (TIGR02300 family)
MPAKDLGVKHTCWKCSTKFYDLKKPNAVCPKCGADPREAPVVKPVSAAAERRRAREEPAAVPEVATEIEEADLEEEGEDAAEDEAEEAGEDAE